MAEMVPVITIDGPSGAGKGTVSALLARRLGWQFLDSGALYRVLAIAAMHHKIEADDEQGLVPLASGLDVNFVSEEQGCKIVLEGEDVSMAIRGEEVGSFASQIAAIPTVREALLRRQRAFREMPGLVADGRDMGTVVFPNALAKIFLTASAEERAQRRFNQLKAAGRSVSIDSLLADIKARDERDMNRATAPLVPAKDAFVLDSTSMSVNQVLDSVVEFVESKPQ